VLLAEDGRENCRLLSFLLSKAGAEVVVAENGQQALEMAVAAEQHADSGAAFDLILMDMQMPVMDGYDATRHLRQQGYTGKIVAVTGRSRDFDRQKCLEAGCDDYMAKPIDRQRLVELIALHTRQPA
jgi:CheY-like chemotaxis protein